MPCRYEIFSELNILCIKYSGVVRISEFLELLDALDSDPSYRDDMNELDDFRDVSVISATPAQVVDIAKLVVMLYRRRNSEKDNAIIAPPWVIKKVIATYARFVSKMSNVRIAQFDDLSGALHFLDVSPSDAVEISDWLAESVVQTQQ